MIGNYHRVSYGGERASSQIGVSWGVKEIENIKRTEVDQHLEEDKVCGQTRAFENKWKISRWGVAADSVRAKEYEWCYRVSEKVEIDKGQSTHWGISFKMEV